MPSILNATTTSGLVTSADNSGSLQLQTNNGTTAVTIDTSQNVGVGTTSPNSSAKLTLADAGGSGAVARVQFNSATSGVTNGTRVGFTAAGFQPDFEIWNGDAGIVRIATNNTERMRITSGGDLQFNSGYGSVATAYGCRAWVNFAGATGTINASGGVSSVTRNGTGDYTVNYSFTFPDANYTMLGMGRRNSATQRPVLMCLNNSGTYNQFTTSARFYTMLNDSATIEDPVQFWFMAVR